MSNSSDFLSVPFPSESAIEDYVYGQILNCGTCPISGDSPDLVYRQKEIPGYGVTDIIKVFVGVGFISIHILELKNEPLKEAHVSQLCRYITGARRLAQRYKGLLSDSVEIEVLGQLAGPQCKEDGDFVYLINEMDRIAFYDLRLDMESGFRSSAVKSGWFSTGERFSRMGSLSRDIAAKYAEHIESLKRFMGEHNA